jgi:hypothetical protein
MYNDKCVFLHMHVSVCACMCVCVCGGGTYSCLVNAQEDSSGLDHVQRSRVTPWDLCWLHTVQRDTG